MPKHTRVYRCVHRLKKKHGLSAAIGICQKATKQSYRTGRTLRKRRRKRKRRGGNPIKWYKTWRRRQEGQQKRRIVRRNRKREQMVKEVSAQLWAEEPEENFDANATARRLLRQSYWNPDMAMHLWYEAHPEQDTMRDDGGAVGAAPNSVPEGGARKKRKSRVRHHRSRKKRHQRRTRKKRGGAHIADGPPPETVEGVTTPAGTVVAAPPPDPAQVAAEDFAAALEPIGAIPAPPMPFNPAQAATHIQARYRGNRDRWLAAHRREGLQRREARRQRRRERDETEAEQNALNMAPTGIFWLDRMRVAEAAAHAYATAPASVAEAAAAASFTGGRRRSRKKRHHRRRRRRRRRTRNDN